MNVTILNPKEVLYEGEARSVLVPGDQGEFELLDYHAPIISLLRHGQVVVDWERRIPVEKGIVRFDRDECVVLVEN